MTRYEAKCVQRKSNAGRSLCVQISRDNGATPANILIPLQRQLIALYNFAADSFYIMLIFALDKLNIRHISTSGLVDLLT